MEIPGIVGAILTGGGSTRMGTPKHALPMPDGRMMIEHVRDNLLTVCAEIVTIGGGPHLHGVRHIHDVKAGLGPLGGLETLLESRLAENYLVVPCDMPLLTGQVLGALLALTGRPVTALRVVGQDWVRSLPLRVHRDALPAVRGRIERTQLSIDGLLADIAAEVVEIPEAWEPLLANINTPEEFALLSRSTQ
jgi:molybdopterin-guanine dinucleotide biosynthesis protein A